MSSIGAYEAKTHLAELLDRVEQGERITITRHGRPVAQLIPPPGARERTVHQTVRSILEFRKGRRLGPGISLRELIDEGRG